MCKALWGTCKTIKHCPCLQEDYKLVEEDTINAIEKSLPYKRILVTSDRYIHYLGVQVIRGDIKKEVSLFGILIQRSLSKSLI